MINIFLIIILYNIIISLLNIGKPHTRVYCGLISYIGRDNYSLDKLKILLLMNEHRGTDSCGAYIGNKGIVKVDDKVSKWFIPHVHIPESNVFLGHVRQGTIGSKVKENSHPFREDSLIQIHNGKIDNHIAFSKSEELDNYVVDSHAMLKVIKKYYDLNNDPKDFMTKSMDIVEGAIALMLFDKKNPDQVIFFRNKERPLFYGEISEGNYYFSSIDDALLSIGIPKEKVVDVDVNTIYVLNVKTNTIEKIPFVKTVKNAPFRSSTVPAPTSNIKSNTNAINHSLLQVYSDALLTVNKPVSSATARMYNQNTIPMVFKPKTTERDDDSRVYFEVGSHVEFITDDNEIIEGKIKTKPIPPNNAVYVVEAKNGRIYFVKNEDLSLIEDDDDDDSPIDKNLSFVNEYVSFIDPLTGEEKIGLVTYDNLTDKEYMIDIPKDDSYARTDWMHVPYTNINKIVEKKSYDTFWSYYFHKDAFTETTQLDEEFDYAEYDDAYSLYNALNSDPSFNDENKTAELISTEDWELHNRLTDYKNSIKGKDVEKDAVFIEEIKKNITSILNRRSQLLVNLIEFAKTLEERKYDN